MSESNPAAVALGRLGGLKKSKKKRAAVLLNLKKANKQLKKQRLQTSKA